MREDPIGIFDSGIGGLNVLGCCERLLPEESFIYLADGANMPYGEKTDDAIRRAAVGCAEVLFSMNCKAVVIACNTATAIAFDTVRAMYPTRLTVGLEPAVRPCVRELGRHGYAVALVTPATCRSERFSRLIAESEGRVVPVAAEGLARLIERCGDPGELRSVVEGLLSPHKKAEAVVLGCSHYTYISGMIREFYGGEIKIYDGAERAAEKLGYLLSVSGLRTERTGRGSTRFYNTLPAIRR